MLDNYDKRLKAQVLNELTDRARGGIFSYAIIWFSSAFWADLYALQPLFFWLNSLFFALLCLVRLSHYIVLKKQLINNVELLSRWLIISVLVSALHLGLVTAWVVTHAQFDKLHYFFLIATTAFAMAGTANLAISKEIRSCYPYFALLPSILAGLVIEGEENLFLAILAIFALFYIVSTAKIAAADYWNAVHNNMLAEDRALLLEQLNNTDPLTKLHNRLYFDSCFIKEWKRCTRQASPISLMMIDLDHFKLVNDSFGHQFGDLCLIEVAKVLSNVICREFDVVARYGGEEFIVLLPATDLKSARQVADNILNSVASIALECNGEKVVLGCSIGIQSIVPSRAAKGADLIKQADDALYFAKNSGRHRYHIYDLACA